MTVPTLAQTVADALEKTGSAYLTGDTSLFTKDDWVRIEDIIFHRDLPWENVTVGDADEPNDVHVGRFMTDIDRPRLVNAPLSQTLLSILGSEQTLSFFKDVLKADELYIRRVQVNKMGAGSFVGLHLDQDSNPDYEISIVLQLGQFFSGGEFVVQADEATRHSYAPVYRSILVSRCDLPHEVQQVTDGARTSLVFFLSRHDGENRKKRLALNAA